MSREYLNDEVDEASPYFEKRAVCAKIVMRHTSELCYLTQRSWQASISKWASLYPLCMAQVEKITCYSFVDQQHCIKTGKCALAGKVIPYVSFFQAADLTDCGSTPHWLVFVWGVSKQNYSGCRILLQSWLIAWWSRVYGLLLTIKSKKSSSKFLN